MLKPVHSIATQNTSARNSFDDCCDLLDGIPVFLKFIEQDFLSPETKTTGARGLSYHAMGVKKKTFARLRDFRAGVEKQHG